MVHAWLDWDGRAPALRWQLPGFPRIGCGPQIIGPSHSALYQPYMDPSYRALASVPQVTMINNSRAGADDYADWIGISRSRIQVIHNAVDFGDRTRLPPDDIRQRREALGIPHDALVVGGVFRLAPEKRPLLWLDTAAIVARRRRTLDSESSARVACVTKCLPGPKRLGLPTGHPGRRSPTTSYRPCR